MDIWYTTSSNAILSSLSGRVQDSTNQWERPENCYARLLMVFFFQTWAPNTLPIPKFQISDNLSINIATKDNDPLDLTCTNVPCSVSITFSIH